MSFEGRFWPHGRPVDWKPKQSFDLIVGVNGELRCRDDHPLFRSDSVAAADAMLATDVRHSPSDGAASLRSVFLGPGVNGLSVLNGDYSFALIGDCPVRLTLGLAPLSELELYYHQGRDGAVSFASSLPRLLSMVSPDFDLDALGRSLHFPAFIADDGGLYRDVYRVLPGSCMDR